MMAYHSQQEEKVSVIMGQLVPISTIFLPRAKIAFKMQVQ